MRGLHVGAQRAWVEVGEAEEELAVLAGGFFGAFDELAGLHAVGVQGDVAAGVGEVFQGEAHGVDDAGELGDGDGADVDGLGEFGVGEEGEAAVGGEEGAEGLEIGAEPLGADFEGEVGALEMLEDLGEGLVGRVEWDLERDGEGPPLHPGQGRVAGVSQDRLGDSTGEEGKSNRFWLQRHGLAHNDGIV